MAERLTISVLGVNHSGKNNEHKCFFRKLLPTIYYYIISIIKN